MSVELSRMFALIAGRLSAHSSVEATLDEVVRLAVIGISGCDYAGVTLLRGDELTTPACTDDLVRKIDARQYELNEGPCVAAFERETIQSVPDMSTDQRWPRFVAYASGMGIASMLSCDLTTPRDTVGALNLYAREPDAFTEHARELLPIYAMHAGIAFAHAQVESQLRAAMSTRQGIGEALGILMATHNVTSPQAFAMLTEASQRLNVKLRDIAASVVDSHNHGHVQLP
jgi:transcriptional regulator with GAF, ATPase, and Fis domain